MKKALVLTFPDGKTVNREFKAGDVIFMKGQTHIGENIGDPSNKK